jgi:cytochrome c5
MNTKKRVGLLAAAAIALAIGCQSSSPEQNAGNTDKNDVQKMDADTSGKAGPQLWSENCARCHNLRTPEGYSDAQWDIIVHHMRLRANLTGQEARKIAEFLKASN